MRKKSNNQKIKRSKAMIRISLSQSKPKRKSGPIKKLIAKGKIQGVKLKKIAAVIVANRSD
jgi:hypothetical protein